MATVRKARLVPLASAAIVLAVDLLFTRFSGATSTTSLWNPSRS